MFSGKAIKDGGQLTEQIRRLFWKAATIRGTTDKSREINRKPSKRLNAGGQAARERLISSRIFCRLSNSRISRRSRSLTASAVRETKSNRAERGLEKNTPIRKSATGRKGIGNENPRKK